MVVAFAELEGFGGGDEGFFLRVVAGGEGEEVAERAVGYH